MLGRLSGSLLALVLLAGCSGAVEHQPGGPALDPLAFFSGQTRGSGTLDVFLKPPVPIRVVSSGRRLGDDGLLLEQSIREGAKPARRRRWLLRRTSATRIDGTLSDAAGPVSGTLRGRQLHLAYALPGGMIADQRLTLQPDGRTLVNAMEVRRLGLTVASVDETIRKLD